jgi:cell division protein FtsQ
MRFLILLALLIITIVGVMHEKGLLQVNQIEIELEDSKNNKNQYWGDLIGKIRPQLKEFENKNLWQVPLLRVAEKFQSEIWVKSVSVSRSWPQKLIVKIKNKEIKLLGINTEGRLIPIESNGDLLPPISWSDAPKKPLLRGLNFMTQITLRKKILDFIDLLPREGSFNEKQISDFTYNDTDGFVATIVWKSLQINLGFEPSTLVLLRVSQVLDYLQSRNINVRVIDANFSKKVLVKLRNQP